MSRSDKRGATLPKVATVALLLRKDGVGQCFPYRGKWHGVPIEVMYESFYTISAYIKISLFDLFRQLRVTLVATFPDREGKIKYGVGAMTS